MNVVPIDVPSRAELWRRQRLALSILGHREPTPENWEALKQVLQGHWTVRNATTGGGS